MGLVDLALGAFSTTIELGPGFTFKKRSLDYYCTVPRIAPLLTKYFEGLMALSPFSRDIVGTLSNWT
ncbi:unnamed protein product [Calypogeia fissa]